MSIVVSAGFVLVYIFLGGLSGAIYNEVLQFFVIIAGLIPIVIIGLKDMGGWSDMQKVTSQPWKENHFETWAGTSVGNWTNQLGDWIGIVMGLGFVLSFGYWTANCRSTAGAFGKAFGRRAYATDRGVPEDLHPRPDHHSRPDRRRAHPELRYRGPGL